MMAINEGLEPQRVRSQLSSQGGVESRLLLDDGDEVTKHWAANVRRVITCLPLCSSPHKWSSSTTTRFVGQRPVAFQASDSKSSRITHGVMRGTRPKFLQVAR